MPIVMLTQGSPVERAIHFATLAHLGQVDKAGRPYILHPLRLMSKVVGDVEQQVAVLHDVLEDCEGISFYDLQQVFGLYVAEGVRCLTKSPGEPRTQYLLRIISAPALLHDHVKPISIKLLDIEDNMSPERLYYLPSETRDKLILKYHEDLVFIKDHLGSVDIVDQLLRRFKTA
jgi:(p)ppGpp synthase/HD superfamily hydrolase